MKKNIMLGTIGILIFVAMLISFSHVKNKDPINTTNNIVQEQKGKTQKNTNGQATVSWNHKETFSEKQGDYEFFAGFVRFQSLRQWKKLKKMPFLNVHMYTTST